MYLPGLEVIVANLFTALFQVLELGEKFAYPQIYVNQFVTFHESRLFENRNDYILLRYEFHNEHILAVYRIRNEVSIT